MYTPSPLKTTPLSRINPLPPLPQVLEGTDALLTLTSLGGAAHLAATIGLAMLPIMDSVHQQRKACVVPPLVSIRVLPIE